MDRRRTLSPPRSNHMRASTGSVVYEPRPAFRSSLDQSAYDRDPEAYYRSMEQPASRISGRPTRREPDPDEHIHRRATSPLPRVPYPRTSDERLYEPSYYRSRRPQRGSEDDYPPSPRFDRAELTDPRFERVQMPEPRFDRADPRYERLERADPRYDRLEPASPRVGRIEREREPVPLARGPIVHGPSRFTREPDSRSYAAEEGEYIVSSGRSGRRRLSNQRYPLSTRDLDRYALENEAAEAERARAARAHPPSRRIAIPPYDSRDLPPSSPSGEEQYSYGDEYDDRAGPSNKPLPHRPRRNSDDEPPRSRIYDPSYYRPTQPPNYASSGRGHARLSSRDDGPYRIDTSEPVREPRHWSIASPHPEEFDRQRALTEPVSRPQPPELKVTKPETPSPAPQKPTNYKPPAVFDDTDSEDDHRKDKDRRDRGDKRERRYTDERGPEERQRRESQAERPVSPFTMDPKVKEDPRPPRGILKEPTQRFPDRPIEEREGVLPLKENLEKKNIPANARWTRINRKLVNAEALREKGERFQELWGANGKSDYVIVLRPLSQDEIVAFTKRTAQIREEWDREDERLHREKEERRREKERERERDRPRERDGKELDRDRPRERDGTDLDRERPRERDGNDLERDRPRQRDSKDYDRGVYRERDPKDYERDRPRERDSKDYERDRPRERDSKDYERDRPRERDSKDYDRPRDRGGKDYDRDPRERRKTLEYEPDRKLKDDRELRASPEPITEKRLPSPKLPEKKAVGFKDDNPAPKPVIVNHKNENDDGTNRYTIQKAGTREVMVASHSPVVSTTADGLKEDPEVRKVTFKGVD